MSLRRRQDLLTKNHYRNTKAQITSNSFEEAEFGTCQILALRLSNIWEYLTPWSLIVERTSRAPQSSLLNYRGNQDQFLPDL